MQGLQGYEKRERRENGEESDYEGRGSMDKHAKSISKEHMQRLHQMVADCTLSR